MVRGTCVLWNDDGGWGALRSPELEHDVWCHFSALDFDGYGMLNVGEPLDFEWEVAEQDGYHLRATLVRRPGVPSLPPQPPSDGVSWVDEQLVLAKPDPNEDPFLTKSRRAREVTRAALRDLWDRMSPWAGLSMWEPEAPLGLMAAIHVADHGPLAQVSANADGAAVLVGEEAALEAIDGGTVEQRAVRIVGTVERLLRDAGRLPSATE